MVFKFAPTGGEDGIPRLRASRGMALTRPRRVIHSHALRIPSFSAKQKTAPKGGFCFGYGLQERWISVFGGWIWTIEKIK